VTASACGISGALSAAGANQYVLLGPGYFYINGGIAFPSGKSNLVLRGSGADQTFIIMTGSTGCLGLGAAICVGNSGNPSMPSPPNTTTWTAGYSRGTTVITVGSSAGMAVGNVLILDQCDTGYSGNACTGTNTDPGLTGFYVCTQPSCSTEGQGGAGNNKRANRSQQQLVRITNISGTSITITPPIEAPNWSSGLNPGASWYNGNMSNDGVESLSVDCSACGFGTGTGFNVGFVYNHDVWVYGVRSLYSQRSNVSFYQVLNGTAEHNYLMGTQSASSESYGIELYSTTNILIMNNICQGPVGCVSQNAPDIGSVVLYNYAPESRVGSGEGLTNGIPSFIHHDWQMLGLTEGNNGLGWELDSIHATHVLETGFRNLLTGDVSDYKTGNLIPVRLFGLAGRFTNVIGNVLGNNNNFYTSYWTNDGYGPNSDYNTGEWLSTPDPLVAQTLYRWGNWDNVTAQVRWCGGSLPSYCSGSEVPSGLSFLPQPVPASQTLPTTFFNGANTNFPTTAFPNGGTGLGWWNVCLNYPACTSFFTPPFPPVGPDVTNGDVNGYAGYASYNPAALVWHSLPIDTHYKTGNQAQATISTITKSGQTATVTFTSAAPASFSSAGSFTINISGSSVAGYNQNWQITSESSSTGPTSITIDDPRIAALASSAAGGTVTPTPVLQFNAADDYQLDPDPSGPPPNPPFGLSAVVAP
jgi:hypothetical protein